MAKRRKRTNKDVPAKGRLRDMADRLWATAIKIDWANKCAVCGHRGTIHAHHLIPRHNTATRYEPENGLALCPSCHLFNPHTSPHQNALGWLDWLRDHYVARYKWWIDHQHDQFEGTKTADYYLGVIQSLKDLVEPEQFMEIVGPKLANWLEEQE